MATYFGEIIEPSTRAISADFSDDEDSLPEVKLSLSIPVLNVPSQLDTVYIVCGKLALGFAELYWLNDLNDPIGKIECLPDGGSSAHTPVKCNYTSLLYIEKSNLICLVNPNLDSTSAYDIVDLMTPYFGNCKKIVIISSESVYKFKSSSVLTDLPAAFSFSLRNNHYSSQVFANKLPVPNIVSGVPAQVLTWSEIHKVPAVLYVTYSDSEALDSITSAPLLKLTKNLSISLATENPNFQKKLFFSGEIYAVSSSNMYL